jgi:hypothetical protein
MLLQRDRITCGRMIHRCESSVPSDKVWISGEGYGAMTYQLEFLKDDGSPACFFMTQCVSDEQAKAIAKSVLDVQFAGVAILRDEQVIYRELKSAKPN